MKREIADRLGRGESTDQVLAAFTARYGEKVLSSPTFRGFNWLAWVTPFGVVLIAAGVLVAVIQRRVRTTTVAARPAAPGAEGDPALRARLARELDDLDRD
jgi:cytochrome c-type biogenesis protein CcmH/NrfF